MDLKQHERDMILKRAEFISARKLYIKTKKNLKEVKQKQKHIDEASEIIQHVASMVQKNWYHKLGSIVTKCLRAVFENTYELKLVFKQLASSTQIQFLLQKDMEEYNPMDSTGGGIVDVASFALRVAALMMNSNSPRKLFILDEPFRFVSEEYRSRIGTLLEELSREFEVQFVIVTHMQELESAHTIRIK